MMMLIRSATEADARLIAEVHVASWKEAYRGQLHQTELDKLDVDSRTTRWQQVLADGSSTTLVCEAHGRLIGFVNYGPCRDSDADPQGVGEINSIYVDPAFWDTGVGRALCQEAIQRLVATGFGELSLWVLATNARARRFYEGAGFLPDGAVKEETLLGAPGRIVRYRKNLIEIA
jgi:ribosomal protein S18 acetylase RimI-like enzyme